ncbi:erythrocyte membrane protein 1, PfEMP1, putative [Plasmodium reichenowi]|uniref:Erythrocyte membrane protein 1, PfEMP1, putative n=1 Tax=Plasmodium reichenowi TaxID=5854 RepID=A0A2P9D5P3_PLARE|nr:erythrocyte membrane protein 1, PfEMP1, putative [Plasmodium reichenowi]
MATVGGGDSSRDESVKHLFDRIGKKVYEKTEKIAKRYTTELHGDLSKASYPNDEHPEGSTENNPCKLQYDYNTNVTHGFGQEYPCETDIVERFSDTEGAQCDKSKIKDSNGKTGEACAPFRRLNLCVRNLQNINHINKINNKHNLLVEVCLAAKHEGDSITGRYPQYQGTNSDFNTNICTVLARSFADIGDIIRGKDLYRGGNTKEKRQRQQLDDNLKEIFKNIKNTNPRLTDLTDDQIREYWWKANREKVWKAITCNAGSYQYSQPTCSEEPLSQQKCSCPNAGVPTNFDYVPQYLRWFEEWAEDFCRKKKKKIPNVKTNCRQVEEGKEKYCSVGGHNCEGTIRKQYIYRLDTDCTKCSVACKTFAEWIDNQKHQFDKQVKKYTNEISGGDGRRQKRSTHSTKEYKGYEKHFNEELRNEGKDVRSFLQLLSKEKTCKERIQVGEETANYGNFENETNTFSHTKYCDPCPMCGVDCSNGNCKENPEGSCDEQITEKVYPDSNTTKIPKLTAEKRKRGILKKYEKFCQKNEEDDQIKNWECHYEKKNEEDENDESGDSNNCILGEWKTFKNERNPISYYSFFYGSIIDMLNDSIEWREGLKKCLQNDKKDCISKCNSRCDCYKRWVEKKKEEWKKIKEHFGKQGDMQQNIDRNKFLEFYLKSNFLDDMIKAHADTKVIEKFREILGKENEDGLPNFSNEKRIIEEFLNGEQKKAEDCLNTHTKNDCPKVESPLRSDTSHDGPQSPAPNHEEHELSDDDVHDDDDDFDDINIINQEEENDSEENVEEPANTEESPQEPSGPVGPTTVTPACDIVSQLFQNPKNLQDACSQKYGKNNSRLGWKCIPTGNGSSNTSEGSSDGGGRAKRSTSGPDSPTVDKGAICVPPRRRRLYIGKIKEWADKQMGKTQDKDGDKQVEGQGNEATAQPNGHADTSGSEQSSTSTSPTPEDPPEASLRRAFVESAAVETFFLWHNYKEQWRLENGGGSQVGVDGPRGQFEVSDSGSANTIFGTSGPRGLQGQQLTVGMTGAESPHPHEPAGKDGLPGLQGLQSPLTNVEGGVSWTGKNVQAQLGGPNGVPGPSPPGSRPLSLQLDSNTLYHASDEDSENPSPQQQLLGGTIPEDFKRQMFYTLGDYRDICVGNTDVVEALSDEQQNDMKKIKDAIEQILPKNGTLSTTSVKSVQTSGDKQKPSVSDPQSWWNGHAESIWNGMICALSYDTNTQEKIESVYNQLIDSTTGKPTNDYTYENVELNESTDGRKGASGTKLKEFVEIPPFFRWFEEWGENFCKKRKEMLEKIKGECTEEVLGRNGGTLKQKYSGHGESCDEIREQKYDIFKDLEGSTCSKPCRWYKMWIRRKKEEYEKQSGAYTGQKTKCENGSEGAESNKDAKRFCGTLGKDAATFLHKLASCKNNDSESGKDKLNFSQPDVTFRPATNCGTCPAIGVNCGNGDCNGSEKNICDGKRAITNDIIEKMGNFTDDVSMLAIDNDTKQFEDDGLRKACRGANIFEGIREDKWKCGYFCGVDICKAVKVKWQKDNDKEYIQIRALVTQWVDNFLEDYKKIKRKISHSTKKGEEPKCIKECVEKWIEIKRGEWKKITGRFNQQYKREKDEYFNVRSVLETLIPQIPVANAKKDGKKLIKLSVFDKSCGCSANANKQTEDGKYKDAIDCMLTKLQKKISECKEQHSGEEKPCVETSTHVGDVDDPLEEEEDPENTVAHPQICNDAIPKTKTDETDDKCEKAPSPGTGGEEEKNKKETDEEKKSADAGPAPDAPEPAEASEGVQPEQGPVKDTEIKDETKKDQPKVVPKEDKKQKPASQPIPRVEKNPFEHPAVIPSLATSTLAWSIGIGFVALSYWWLLKKKTKRPVDLFSVIDIPKGDYDIPTFKSSNSYIPYASGKYRGKRYIYLEGDTDEDKYAFTSDTTDVTSSESEYEEMDINDIYVHGSPKYKTLIEVVLEPSTRDTFNTPSADTPTNKLTDIEWNELKHYFISNMLQSEQNDVPNDYTSGNSPTNSNNTTMLRDNMEEKPFIMSIHDRNLYTGEEYSYDMSNNISNNDLYSGQNNLYSDVDSTSDNRGSYSDNHDSLSGNHHPYSGIDLINDSLNSGNHDIYDEILKRKENELFGTEHHPKHITTNSVAKNKNSDPIMNQLDLFNKWLDRHRHMCEKWDTNNKKEELFGKLKEEWDSDKLHTPIDDIPSDIKTLNTDVSIKIDMDNPKTKNEFKNMDTTPNKSTMDTILDDLEKYNEPYYYDMYDDDIYYDVNDDKTSVDHINMDYNKMDNNNSDVPNKVHIEMNIVNNKKETFEEEYPMSDIWNI